MRVAIIGAGSIGCLFAGYIARAGLHVTIVTKGQRQHGTWREGLIVERVFDGSSFIQDEIVVSSTLDVVAGSDCIFVAVKAFDLEPVMRSLEESGLVVPERHVFCLVQNGLGVERVCRDHFPAVPLLRITTTHGAALAGAGRVQHTGSGTITYGFWDSVNTPAAARVVDALRAAFVLMGMRDSIHPVDDIAEAVWEKFIVNAGINAVGTIFNVTNGSILSMAKIHQISMHLVDEAIRVARHEGRLMSFDGHGAVRSVATATSMNKNSMLQDMARGRRTEIDFINGMACKIGRAGGIPTPWNDVIVAIIHGMEEMRDGRVNA